jgi:hypothetical protein
MLKQNFPTRLEFEEIKTVMDDFMKRSNRRIREADARANLNIEIRKINVNLKEMNEFLDGISSNLAEVVSYYRAKETH